MKAKLVVGNWKMNGDLAANRALLEQVSRQGGGGVERAVCVPFPYLAQAQSALAGTPVALGAQNASEFAGGAYTGEVAPAMLSEFGCRYVIVGHSERRSLFGEDDAMVARKAHAVLGAGLTPIVCVGESLAEREAGAVEDVLGRQLDALSAALAGESIARLVIAYEPVWAIGTGRAASPAQVQDVLGFIRGWLRKQVGPEAAAGVRILYGGSVKPDTAPELFSLPDSDGGLIGGASLVADQFNEICDAAAAASRNA